MYFAFDKTKQIQTIETALWDKNSNKAIETALRDKTNLN